MPKCCPPDSKKSLRNRQGYTDCIQLLINVYLSQRLPNRCSRTAVCRVKNCSATKAKQDGAAQVPCFVDQLWSGLRPCTRRAGIWRKNPSTLQVLVAFLWKKVASVHLIPRRLQPRQIPANCHLKLSGDCAFVGIYGDQEFMSWFEFARHAFSGRTFHFYL